MSGFTRLALVVLTGMTGRILRRSRRKTRQSAGEGAAGSPSTTKSGQAQSALVSTQPNPGAAPDLPVDHFRQLSAQGRTPLLATVAARSLPVIGLLGLLMTLVLAIGVVRGELPFIGVVADANLAWASVLVSISIWAVYLLWKVPQWQAAAWARSGSPNPRELFEIENESRGTLGQILSGVAVLTGLIFAWQQLGQTSDNLRVSEEGQITDRFSRAVDQLGSDQFTIRLGGIYALERIARDSPRDYEPVMEVLTAFARQESPLPKPGGGTPIAVDSVEIPLDVQAVFKVIGRRTPAQIEIELEEGGCLDLTGISAVGADLADYDLRNTCWDRSDLRGAIVARADLSRATFVGTNFQQANLDSVNAAESNYNGANFTFANLSKANFAQANLLAADLVSATLQDTSFESANLVSANLAGALAFGADFTGADMLATDLNGTLLTDAKLAGAEQLTQDQVAAAVTNGGTTLPEGIDVPPDL